MMKRFISALSLIALVTFGVMAQCCNTAPKTTGEVAENNLSQQEIENEQVAVWYFHATRRCATCQAVEKVTAQTLKETYGDKVPFKSVNREEESTHPLMVKHKISGQTLLIIKGDKVVNLTTDAFLNARTNPEKFKEKLIATINAL